MVDFIKFYDFSTFRPGGGSKWSIFFNFFDFSTWRGGVPIEWDDSELDIFSYLKRTLICDKLHCDCYHCAISVVMDPRNQKWLRHQMVILSSTRTRLMNFQSELFLRTNERQISLSMYELPYTKKKSPSPPTRILSYYVPTQSKKNRCV